MDYLTSQVKQLFSKRCFVLNLGRDDVMQEGRWMFGKKRGDLCKLCVHFCPRTVFHLLDFYGYSESLRLTFHLNFPDLLENYNLRHPHSPPPPPLFYALLCPLPPHVTVSDLLPPQFCFRSPFICWDWGTCSTEHQRLLSAPHCHPFTFTSQIWSHILLI